MAKKREPAAGKKDDRGNRKSAPIQIEKELARMAAVIASHRGITLSDLCSPVLRPFLIAQYRLVQAEMAREIEAADSEG